MHKKTTAQLHVLFLEAYPGESHRRASEVLQRHSRHRITIIEASRDHWMTLALVSHLELADRISQLQPSAVDLIIVSGTTNLPGLLLSLPPHLQGLPVVSYMHESQWSYPSTGEDSRSVLVQHLDAIRHSSEIWFNSRFHREDMQRAAGEPFIDRRIRQEARALFQASRPRLRVVYPPVEIDCCSHLGAPADGARRVVWNARWEHDKRPDRFVEAVRSLVRRIGSIDVLVLGTAGKDTQEITSMFAGIAGQVSVPGHLHDRTTYEQMLAGGGIIISTADHEFFGIGVLESVLAGLAPVVPAALAYSETIPSAWFYPHGDTDALVDVMQAALASSRWTLPLHMSDARRFLAARSVSCWDANMERVVFGRRSDSQAVRVTPGIASNR